MIYKYRKFDEYTFEELAQSKIYGSLPSILNDPFDSLMNYDFRDIYQSISNQEKFENLYKIYLKTRPAPEKFDPSDNSYLEDERNKFVDYIFLLLRSSFYVFCFSDSPTNTVLWAHYADSYKGIVLSYDAKKLNDCASSYCKGMIENDNFLKQFSIRPIEYLSNLNVSKEELIADFEKIIDCLSEKDLKEMNLQENTELFTAYMKNFFNISFFTKTIPWQYEGEWRLVLPCFVLDKRKCKNGHCEMEDINPCRIFFSKNITDKDKYCALSLAEKKNINVYQIEAVSKQTDVGLKGKRLSNQMVETILSFLVKQSEN